MEHLTLEKCNIRDEDLPLILDIGKESRKEEKSVKSARDLNEGGTTTSKISRVRNKNKNAKIPNASFAAIVEADEEEDFDY